MRKQELKEINPLNCFTGKPRYRYSKDVAQGEEDTSGERFRKEFLLPLLEEYEKVRIILTGYNRYDPSFLISGIVDLIRENGYGLEELKRRLTYVHTDLKSFEKLIDDELELAEQERLASKG
ncbi:STAS-like domain-containing protein [Actinobacillus equuli subsp. haemolyticus]|uniref:STAS-like domain-containing protein n=1 Tax=Actinobacillus equuli TaxID=718 RepID=UPI002442EBEB|nr:DUF4325 domain-containing protein [Actinobacillus equuli]WGE67689.1 STAS-like domain-containing protein [Actinobacillus equuli subsp. haemolyticus]